MVNISAKNLCFGTMTFGNKGIFSRIGSNQTNNSIELVRLFYDAGIRRFDTAYGYSDGASEHMLGNALKSYSNVYICSKVSKSINGNKSIDLSYRNIINSCMMSLKNLKVDRINLFLLHGFDSSVNIAESISALEWLCDHQMIAEYGVSNFTGYQLAQAIELGTERFTSVQYKCSFLERNYTWDMLDLVIRKRIHFYGYSILGGGLLTGKYIHCPTNDRYRFNRLGIKIEDDFIKKTKKLYNLAQAINIPIEKLAIQSVMADLDYIIIGASNIKQAEYLLEILLNE
ncbi:aldo/keto reductase [Brenneria rubrifaciens]|uniref:Aldo/keto reductase n=1 Tax=Brenneria rubrifaciens TaxID=55213 RepID=A0A4P8QMG0_9GAMM|nr:aldo/keto reductase [Brenneria rubrifaciens]QCR08127.1 aldo/keto reductase [Brenneria rubrifaciens]